VISEIKNIKKVNFLDDLLLSINGTHRHIVYLYQHNTMNDRHRFLSNRKNKNLIRKPDPRS